MEGTRLSEDALRRRDFLSFLCRLRKPVFLSLVAAGRCVSPLALFHLIPFDASRTPGLCPWACEHC
jgi:hypothetical protein